MKALHLIIITALILIAESQASSTVAGIELPSKQDNLELQGAGLLRKGFFFRIYVGALYMEATENEDKSLTEKHKRIDIHYFHHTPKKHMIRVADKTLKQNMTPEDLDKIAPMIDELHEAFLNGQKGSVASITHIPGTGLEYSFDQQSIITIPCDDFANAYFSIWLGEHPSSRTIKEAMLGGSR